MEISSRKKVLSSLVSASLVGWLVVACGSSSGSDNGGGAGNSPILGAGAGAGGDSNGNAAGAPGTPGAGAPSGGAPTNPSGGAPGAGAPGVAGAPGSGGGANMCPTDSTDTVCSKCISQKCCSQLLDCVGNTQCSALVSCIADCTTAACTSTCKTTYAGGVADANLLTSCLSGSCNTQCATTPTPTANCENGSQVFCYCAQQLGAGSCTSTVLSNAKTACTSGTPADLSASVKCAATYYVSDTIPPDCNGFLAGCF